MNYIFILVFVIWVVLFGCFNYYNKNWNNWIKAIYYIFWGVTAFFFTIGIVNILYK